MTREIKFRGKRRDNGEWLYGSLLISHFKDDKKERYFITQFSGNYTFEHEVDPATVGQFTGLKDRNGREIYEDDLFKTGYYDTIHRVEWDDNNARYIGRCAKGCIAYVGREPAIEVCGNIHDNPELLKK